MNIIMVWGNSIFIITPYRSSLIAFSLIAVVGRLFIFCVLGLYVIGLYVSVLVCGCVCVFVNHSDH